MGRGGSPTTPRQRGKEVKAATDRAAEEIARAFLTARREARVLDEFPGALPTTLADAYRVQEALIRLDGRPVVGWKVAMIPPALREALGDERICGPVFEGLVRDVAADTEIDAPVHDGGFAALEAEFVARFATAAEPGPSGFDAATIAAALAEIHAGVEVASSPLPTLNAIGPLAVVCDRGNNAGVIVGPPLAGWRHRAPALFASRMTIDGVVVGEGSAASVPGGPLGAVVWLAEHLHRRGRRLSAGDVVSTGMTTGVHDVRPGAVARVDFAHVGGIDLRVVALAPSRPAV